MMNRKDNAKIWLGLVWVVIVILVIVVWSKSRAQEDSLATINQSVEQIQGDKGSDLQGGTVNGSDLQGSTGQIDAGSTADLLQGVQ